MLNERASGGFSSRAGGGRASSRSSSAIALSVSGGLARVHAEMAWPYAAGSGAMADASIRSSSESAPRQSLTWPAALTMARHSPTEKDDAARLALTSDHSPARTAVHSVRICCCRARCICCICLRAELTSSALLGGGRTCWPLGLSSPAPEPYRRGGRTSSTLHRGGREEERAAGRSAGRELPSTQAAPAAAVTRAAASTAESLITAANSTNYELLGKMVWSYCFRPVRFSRVRIGSQNRAVLGGVRPLSFDERPAGPTAVYLTPTSHSLAARATAAAAALA